MPRPAKTLSNDVLFRACEQLLKGVTADEIAKFVSNETNERFTREQVYSLLRKAYQRKLVTLVEPRNTFLADELAKRSSLQASEITVVDISGSQAVERVAAAAAEVAFGAVVEVSKGGRPTHIALGSGRTTQLISRRLAELIAADRSVNPSATDPKLRLVVHALTGGWDPRDPLDAPIAQFGYFDHAARPYAEFIGLSAPPVVQPDLYDRIRKLPLVAPCFAEASKLDIVITGIGTKADEHSSFTRLMLMHRQGKRSLERAGWIGDVQSLPYSEREPLQVKEGYRPFVLVTFERLVELARTKGKHVVLAVGPCGLCNRTKAAALLPLIREPRLRVFSQLVIDVGTANELVKYLS